MEVNPHYSKEFGSNQTTFAGTKNVEQLRRRAIKSYEETGMPSKKDEQWKYTSVFSLNEKAFKITHKPYNPPEMRPLSKWYIYVGNKNNQNLPEGISAEPLEDALNQEDIQQYLNTSKNSNKNTFNDLNMALMIQGCFIKVDQNVCVDEPIHIILAGNHDQGMHCIKNILVLAENAEVNFIEHFYGDDHKEYCTNVETDIFLQQNAKSQYYRIQQESKLSYHIGHVLVTQEPDSSFVWQNFSFGSLLERTYLETNLAKGANASLYGLSILDNVQHVDHNTLVHHHENETHCAQIFKGVYAGSSIGVFKGDIKIHQGAKNATSKQINNNLLLSNLAKVSAQPQLEIYDNDVQCQHGATVGQLDDDYMFYLRTRGLSYNAARHILIKAFIMELIEQIKQPQLTEYIANTIDSVLSNIDKKG